MADATWPATLNIDHMVGLQEQRASGTIRTGTDGGPAKARRRFTSVSRNVTGIVRAWTNTQRQTFDSFYATTLGGGVDEFNWTDPVLGTSVELRFTAEPGFESIGLRSDGPVWRTTLPLELLP